MPSLGTQAVPPAVRTLLVGLQGSGFRAQGSGFRVQGAGCRVQGSGCENPAQASAFRVQDARTLTVGIQGSGHPSRVQDFQVFRVRVQVRV